MNDIIKILYINYLTPKSDSYMDNFSRFAVKYGKCIPHIMRSDFGWYTMVNRFWEKYTLTKDIVFVEKTK